MRANSGRVDLLCMYNVHAKRLTNLQGISVKEFLDIRRRERNEQDRYPLSLVAFQLMELIYQLDEAILGHLKSKYLSLSVEQVTKQTILAAHDEILKIDTTKTDARVTSMPPAARAARPRERPPASSAAVTRANPHSNQGGKSNFGQSNGQSQSGRSGGGKQPYKPGTGRYAPRTGDHHHGGGSIQPALTLALRRADALIQVRCPPPG
jgi:hypothetical protein